MIPECGLMALIFAWILSLISSTVVAWRFASITDQERAKISTALCFGQSFFVILSFVILIGAFVSHDFSLQYVALNSNLSLPWYYQIGAVWGGHEGSLLLWASLLCGWILAVVLGSSDVPNPVRVTVQSTLSVLLAGFLGMMLLTSNPFLRLLPFSPPDGNDLNPLLQDWAFILHPPTLYLGYVGLAVPFAFAIAECIHKTAISGPVWISWVRRYALISVGALTAGITLGSLWAYYELGWGGWWFWDPVENASLMPWLVGCAYVHILWVSHLSPRYTGWRVLLAFMAFILSVLGTFLTRSGVISTVHAFTSDKSRGIYLLGFLTLVILGATLAYLWRGFRSENEEPSAPFSKAGLLLLGSVLWVVSAGTILLGTLYPLFLEKLTGQNVSVGTPYFNTVVTPMWVLGLALMAVAPHCRLSRSDLAELGRRYANYLICMTLVSIAISIACYWSGHFSPFATLAIVLAVILLYSTAIQWPQIRLYPERRGSAIAHTGVAILVLGVVLSVDLGSEKSITLKPGQIAQLEETSLIFEKLVPVTAANYEGVRGYFSLMKGDKRIALLTPEKRYFKSRDIVTTESSLRLYRGTDYTLALGEPLGDDRWSLRIYTKPYVRLIWLGGFIMALGLLSKGWRLCRHRCTSRIRIHSQTTVQETA